MATLRSTLPRLYENEKTTRKKKKAKKTKKTKKGY